MKINSEHLYKYINELATDEKVIFNVYYDDHYVTQIYWNGDNFEWETGTFTSEAFFNPLYDFIPTEEDKKIEKINIKWDKDYYVLDEDNVKIYLTERDKIGMNKINELIDKVNSLEKKQ